MTDVAAKNTDTPPHASSPVTTTSDAPDMEIGGRRGPEPTRYSKTEAGEGDWEVNGRCSDF